MDPESQMRRDGKLAINSAIGITPRIKGVVSLH